MGFPFIFRFTYMSINQTLNHSYNRSKKLQPCHIDISAELVKSDHDVGAPILQGLRLTGLGFKIGAFKPKPAIQPKP